MPTSHYDPIRPHWAIPIGVGVAYGLFARFVFGLPVLDGVLGVMTWGFIYGIPVVMGVLAVLLQDEEPTWSSASFLGWIPTLLVLVGSGLLLWEGLICIIIWAPIALLCASAGGLVGKGVRRLGVRRRPLGLVAVVLPVVFAPIEQRFEPSVQTRAVHDAIEIEASAEAVWREIREVPPIQPAELDGSFAYRIGFPRPIEARLEGEGVGAVRHATFEGGVTFVERVTAWDEGQALGFTIDASAVPSTTFDQHVAVGGRYFDVLTGRYEIERVGPGRVVLHLTSEQRLSTRFNPYTRIWTDRFMSDIQSTILRVIRDRAERADVRS